MLLQLVDWIFCGQRECMGEAGRRNREGGGGKGRRRWSDGGAWRTEAAKLIVIT